jgi:hypothetical protein
MLNLIKENGFIACEEHNYEDIFNYPASNSIDKYRTLLKKISNILQLDYAFGKKLYYEMNLLNIDISYIMNDNIPEYVLQAPFETTFIVSTIIILLVIILLPIN